MIAHPNVVLMSLSSPKVSNRLRKHEFMQNMSRIGSESLLLVVLTSVCCVCMCSGFIKCFVGVASKFLHAITITTI